MVILKRLEFLGKMVSNMEKDKSVTVERESQQVRIPATVTQEKQLMDLMKLAVRSEGGVEKLEKITAMHERYEKNAARKTFFDAMTQFQRSVSVIEKKGLASFDHKEGGGTTSYSYAKIEDIAAAIKKPLSDNGLSYRFEQSTEQSSSGLFVTVTCILTHRDGHFEQAQMSGYQDASGKKNPIQQLASTVSYLRRYTLTGVAGLTVAEEDNDNSTGDNDEVYYPQEQFESNLPNWKNQIQSGKKTISQIIIFLDKKGARLSPDQIKQINSIGNKYEET